MANGSLFAASCVCCIGYMDFIAERDSRSAGYHLFFLGAFRDAICIRQNLLGTIAVVLGVGRHYSHLYTFDVEDRFLMSLVDSIVVYG